MPDDENPQYRIRGTIIDLLTGIPLTAVVDGKEHVCLLSRKEATEFIRRVERAGMRLSNGNGAM